MRSLTLNIARAHKRSGETACRSASPFQARIGITRRDADAVARQAAAPAPEQAQVLAPDRQATSNRFYSARESRSSRIDCAGRSLFRAARPARSYCRAQACHLAHALAVHYRSVGGLAQTTER